jgi:hypothetical protein
MDNNYLLSSDPMDKFRSTLENCSIEKVRELLNEMDKNNLLVKSFEKENIYTQYESEMIKCSDNSKKYLQRQIVYNGSNDKMKATLKNYIAEHESVNLYNKLESNKPIVKLFLEKSSKNDNITLFVVSINIDITSSWLFWSDRKMTISTYSAIIRLI